MSDAKLLNAYWSVLEKNKTKMKNMSGRQQASKHLICLLRCVLLLPAVWMSVSYYLPQTNGPQRVTGYVSLKNVWDSGAAAPKSLIMVSRVSVSSK